MRALTQIALTLMMVSASFSWAAETGNPLSPCETRLETLPQKFQGIVQQLRALGLRALLAPYEQDRVKTVYRRKTLPFQAGVTWSAGFIFSDKLIIRDLKWTSERERQNSVWQVALALYNLQNVRRLWDLRQLRFKDDNHQFDLSMDGNEDALTYFTYQVPSDWRETENGKREAANADLKTLLAALPLVDEPLPGINRARMWTYYEDHIRRLVMIGAVCMIPKLVDIPHCFNAFELSVQSKYELVTSAEKRAQVNRRYREILFAQVREQIQEAQARLPDPDAQTELDELYRDYPQFRHK